MIGEADARRFLATHLGRDVDVELVGEGAWSRCFGFELDGRELVVRFGRYGDDFATDAMAASLVPDTVPVPEVVELGTTADGYFAISTRAHGAPLESIGSDGWTAVLPSLFDVLAALRGVEPAAPGWGAITEPSFATWADFLLAVDDDSPERRTHGWRRRLAESPVGDDQFRRGFDRLASLVERVEVDRRIVHADLINRNVLVDGGHVRAVFDWGCAFYGDPLYDVAWLEFWKPWYPAMAGIDFVAAARRRFRDLDVARRVRTCMVHIGLDHQGWYAYEGDLENLDRVVSRTAALVSGR